MTRTLPERPSLQQLRRQARELYRAAVAGDSKALAQVVAAGADRMSLTSAQFALAREYSFASWARLKAEVERRRFIDAGNVEGLAKLMTADPALAYERVHSCLSAPGTSALGYIGVGRFHHRFDHHRAGDLARAMLVAGAPANGGPGDRESPLITAASYGEAKMARALIEAGANLEATGEAVAGGTALAHAVAFGNSDVVDVLVAAGAVVHDIVEAAGSGDIDGWLGPDTPAAARIRALRAAAVCERLTIIDRLLETETPVDAETDDSGPTALHWAAYEGKPRSVRHLLARGADPDRREREHHSTPLGWCRFRHAQRRGYGEEGGRVVSPIPAYAEVERILEPVTSEPA